MTQNTDRLKHALHNEEVCNYLELKKESFGDWIVTTAFYSALHFVCHKIFPFKVAGIEGKQIEIINIEQFHNYESSKKKSKHELLCHLVSSNCPNISEDYAWLIDASMNARYHHYQVDKEIASKAIRLMKSVKNGCTTKAELQNL